MSKMFVGGTGLEYYLISLVIVLLLVAWFYKRKFSKPIDSSNEQHFERDTNIKIPDKDLWSIREINKDNALFPQHYTELNISRELNSDISSLLQQAPNMKNLINKQETTYLLSFSEKTAQAIKEGKLELMQVKGKIGDVRAHAVNQKGRIVEQGMLKQSKIAKINPTQLAMGVLTTVTAQEHLQQIGNQLKKLNSGVNKILSAIDNKQIGNDKGNIDYLETIFYGLNQGDVSNENIRGYRQQLETIIRTTMQDLSFIKEGFPELIHQLEKEKLKGLWAANKETENITVIINDFEKQCSIYLSKLDVILVCLSLSKYLDPDYSADNSRLDYVLKKLTELEKIKEILFGKVDEIVPEIGARIRFKRENYNLNLQKRIEKQAIKLRNYFDSHKEEFELRLEKTKNSKFFDNTFENGTAEYEIIVDAHQKIKSLKKKERNI